MGKKITEKIMSEIENTLFLEGIHEQLKQAAVDNDSAAILTMYKTLREHGFDKEANEVRDMYGVVDKPLLDDAE